MFAEILTLCIGLAMPLTVIAGEAEEEKALSAQKVSQKNCLRLNLRTRVETFKGSGIWDEAIIQKDFPVSETAILLCDMWDKHWCRGATERVAAMAPIMNSVIKAARKNGVQIIHSPSDTLNFYDDTPYRQRIANTPVLHRQSH